MRLLLLACLARCACLPVPGAAEEPPSVAAYQPPPATALVVVWRYGDTATKVVVLSEKQAQDDAAFITYGKRQAVAWWIWAGAGVLAGAAAGAYAHARLK